MSAQEQNQYNSVNNTNLSLPTVNAQSMRDSASKLQKELFDRLEISNFTEPFTIKMAEDALRGSERGLGGVWKKLGALVRDPRYGNTLGNLARVGEGLPIDAIRNAVEGVQKGGLQGGITAGFNALVDGQVPVPDSVATLVKNAKDKGKNMFDEARQRGGDLVEGAKARVAQVQDGVVDQVDRAQQRVQQAVVDGKERAEAAVGDVRERAEGAVGDVRDSAEAAVGDARGRAEAAVGDVRERAEGAVGDVRDRVDGAGARLQAAAADIEERVAVPAVDSIIKPGVPARLRSQYTPERRMAARREGAARAAAYREAAVAPEPAAAAAVAEPAPAAAVAEPAAAAEPEASAIGPPAVQRAADGSRILNIPQDIRDEADAMAAARRLDFQTRGPEAVWNEGREKLIGLGARDPGPWPGGPAAVKANPIAEDISTGKSTTPIKKLQPKIAPKQPVQAEEVAALHEDLPAPAPVAARELVDPYEILAEKYTRTTVAEMGGDRMDEFSDLRRQFRREIKALPSPDQEFASVAPTTSSRPPRLPKSVSNLKEIGEEESWGAGEKSAAAAHESKILNAALGGASNEELDEMRPELGIFDNKSDPRVLLNHDAEISAHDDVMKRLNFKKGDAAREFATPIEGEGATPIEEEEAPAPAAAAAAEAPEEEEAAAPLAAGDFFLDADYDDGGAVASKNAEPEDEQLDVIDGEANIRDIAARERSQPAADPEPAADPDDIRGAERELFGDPEPEAVQAAPPIIEQPAEQVLRQDGAIPPGLQSAKEGPTLKGAPEQLLTNVSSKETDRVIASRGSGIGGEAASIGTDIEGGVEAAATEALVDPEIDAIPVVGDVAMLAAGLAGALYTSFANKPEAPAIEHVQNVLSSASQLGS